MMKSRAMDDLTIRHLASVDHIRRFRPSSVTLETLYILGRNYQPIDRYRLSTFGSQIPPATATKPSAASGSTGSQKKTGNDGGVTLTESSSNGQSSRPKMSLASNADPTYYIGGGNGNALIEETMNGLGWRRTREKTDDGYRLRWCELKSSINYNTFKEGEQLVNHIPNCNLLTNKVGLLDSLQEYSRVSGTVQKKGSMKLDFVPETYRLDDPKDRQTFIDTYKENEIWICKPTGRNQGKGIFLVRSLAELNQAVSDQREDTTTVTTTAEPQKETTDTKRPKPMNRIIQRYIINPLLVEGRKFDIRCYMLIASTVPYLVLYHKGYLRLSMYEYDNKCDNIIAHLTNQFIQKKDPKYNEQKEETAWSMDRFNEYVNEKLRKAKGIEKDWVYNSLTTTMTQIMTHAFMAVKHKLHRKVGYFDLYGLDFMIDENMKVWLIEVNVNPCLATNCAALREVVPGVVRETLHLAIECFEKSRKGRSLLPLQSLKSFQILHCESPPSSTSKSSGPSGTGNGRTPTVNTAAKMQTDQHPFKPASPVRRSRSMSPAKEGIAKQPKKPDPTTSVVTVAKGKPSEAQREVNSVRPIKGGRSTTTDDAGPTPTAPVERKQSVLLENREKERNAKPISTTTKRKNAAAASPDDPGKKTLRAAVGSAVKEGEKTPSSPSAKPLAKSTANGGESKSVKTPNSTASPVAQKLTNSAAAPKKRQGKENVTVRQEKPNRGS